MWTASQNSARDAIDVINCLGSKLGLDDYAVQSRKCAFQTECSESAPGT